MMLLVICDATSAVVRLHPIHPEFHHLHIDLRLYFIYVDVFMGMTFLLDLLSVNQIVQNQPLSHLILHHHVANHSILFHFLHQIDHRHLQTFHSTFALPKVHLDLHQEIGWRSSDHIHQAHPFIMLAIMLALAQIFSAVPLVIYTRLVSCWFRLLDFQPLVSLLDLAGAQHLASLGLHLSRLATWNLMADPYFFELDGQHLTHL